jgi:hypothetical protein
MPLAKNIEICTRIETIVLVKDRDKVRNRLSSFWEDLKGCWDSKEVSNLDARRHALTVWLSIQATRRSPLISDSM